MSEILLWKINNWNKLSEINKMNRKHKENNKIIEIKKAGECDDRNRDLHVIRYFHDANETLYHWANSPLVYTALNAMFRISWSYTQNDEHTHATYIYCEYVCIGLHACVFVSLCVQTVTFKANVTCDVFSLTFHVHLLSFLLSLFR